MNKKITAIISLVLISGLAIAEPVLATTVTTLGNVNNLASVSGNTVQFPLFVIGKTAMPEDVASAVDAALGLAGNLVTTQNVTIPGTTSNTITNGVSMATPSNPLTMWDNFGSSKQVLTVNDLPTLLTSGTYTDEGSVSSPYAQYLTFTNNANDGQVVYDTPNAGTSPQLGLKFTGGNQLYDYLLSFTRQISETVNSGTVTNMINTQLSVLGQTWTITNAKLTGNQLDLTMLAGKNSLIVTTAAPVTYNVGSLTYTITLVAVGTVNGNPGIVLTVAGGNLGAAETVQLQNGETKTLSDGTMVGVSSIFSTKQGETDSATIFIGANKLELVDNDITDGSFNTGIQINSATLTDAQVKMTGTVTNSGNTLNLNSIEMEWTPTLEQFVHSGNTLSDEITNGAFKIFFGGINPALGDSANRETISVTPSGTTAGISFKDASGDALNQNFVYSTGTGTGNINLADAGNYAIHVVEGQTVNQNEYMVLGQNSLAYSSQNPFGHIIRVLSLSTSSTTTSQFQDMASGSTLTVTGGDTTMYLDGQSYKVHVISSTQVQFTWGTGAGYGTTGNAIDVYPTIQTSKGAWISLTAPITISGLSASTSYNINLPTGSTSITTGTGSSTVTLGQAKYSINAAANSITIKATDNKASPATFNTPSVMIVEGLDESQIRNIVELKMDSDASYNRIDIVPYPLFTGMTTSQPGLSGTTQNQYMDKYGSYVAYDSSAPGTFSMSYPVNQAQAIVAIGTDPSVSGGTTTSTVTTQAYHPVLTDVVKLDTEITANDEASNDLILVGGPCVNTLVTALNTAGKFAYTCQNWNLAHGEGVIQTIANAFGNGRTAVVVAGTDAADTDLVAQIFQRNMPGATAAELAQTTLYVKGTVSNPIYTSTP